MHPPSPLQRHRFWPNSFKLLVRDGDKSNGNVGCDPQEALKPLTMYTVKIQLRDKQVAVYVNDEEVCTSAREDRAEYKKATVYAADPCVRVVCVLVVVRVCVLWVAGRWCLRVVNLVCLTTG